MSSFSSLRVALVAAIILSTAALESLAQTTAASDPQQEGPVMAAFSPPVYPPLAKQARVAGDVTLILVIRQDGSIESAVAASGHPLLKQSALISVQQSHFECRNCNEIENSLSIVYSFQLGPTVHCGTTVPADSKPEQRYPQVIQSQRHITLLDQPIGTCDTAPTIGLKVRSAKCLYLWKCGFRYMASGNEPSVLTGKLEAQRAEFSCRPLHGMWPGNLRNSQLEDSTKAPRNAQRLRWFWADVVKTA
jgi:TonB-like protein